ncbi:MAG: hypothetical protein QNL26_02145 [Acidimicrobiia bacterium]|nr:hypothetical protein [Acidimicrobiia bacterium]
MIIDRRLRRIADQLKTAELVQQSIDEGMGSRFGDLFGDHEPASERLLEMIPGAGVEIDWEAFRASLDASPVPGLELDDFS